MGNRAVITFDTTANAPCIYLHWNGGLASVEGFIEAARRLGLRRVNTGSRSDQAKALDWWAQAMARHFFGTDVGMTVYREKYGEADTDNWDNGVYVLDANLGIAERRFKRGPDEINLDKTNNICERVVSRAPIYND